MKYSPQTLIKMNVESKYFQNTQDRNLLFYLLLQKNVVHRCWINYITTIHKGKNYFYPASSSFEEGDFSWKEFTNKYVLLILNWTAEFGTDNVPLILKKVNACIQHWHISCDTMYKNIRKMLMLGKFKNINDVLKHYQKHKHFRNIFVCFYFYHLMLNCLSYKKNITALQKLFIKIVKKNILPTKIVSGQDQLKI